MPWLIPVATAAYSVIQSESNKSKAKADEKKLESMNTPRYQPNQSILGYYQKALQRYETNPTDSAEYKMQKQNINQGITQGLAGARDRRLGGAVTPALIQGGTNSLLKAAIAGEQRKAQEFGVLGNAAQMRAQEEGKAFHQNEVVPFEKNYNLLAMKAAGQRADQRTSMSNAYNNLSAAAALYDPESQQEKFGEGYDEQGQSAYKWAKNNKMNFGQYKRQGNRVGRSLMNWGY